MGKWFTKNLNMISIMKGVFTCRAVVLDLKHEYVRWQK